MRKNIKKIIIVGVITVSIFTLIGCGQSKQELKEEIKQEIKTEEVQTKVEEAKTVTLEELDNFTKVFKEHQNTTMKAQWFLLPNDSPEKITLEEGKVYKQQADSSKEDIISKAPEVIKDEVANYFNLYDEYYSKISESLKYGEEEAPYLDKVSASRIKIETKIKELRETLINK